MSLNIVRVDSVRAAAAILGADPAARFLGGGTLAVRAWNSGDVAINRFVLPDGLGLDGVGIEAGRAEVGAAVTMARLLAVPELVCLHAAAREIGGPAVRAMATVGGNLFAPSPYGDIAVALLALGADVTAEREAAAETLPLEAFLAQRSGFRGVVRAVSFALPEPGTFRFLKAARRRPHGAAVLSVAAHLPTPGGRVSGARIAYGAMGLTALRDRAAEQTLEGRALDEAAIAAAAAVAGSECSPADDPQASAWYRRAVLPVHLSRLLQGRAEE